LPDPGGPYKRILEQVVHLEVRTCSTTSLANFRVSLKGVSTVVASDIEAYINSRVVMYDIFLNKGFRDEVRCELQLAVGCGRE
jgi:hypothetical protein